ncbi:MAG: hypothetical protein J6P83_11585 [Bacteroidales bacterium]|nr:hypothetical protein [Bacteroidales bacterium]
MKKHLFSVAVLALVVTLTTFTGCRKPQADDNTPAKEGLYLGIVGFNSELYTMPLGLLNQDTKHNFESFVDGLSMQNGTILYHAVNTGLNSLATAKIPENLINVSVVTFTDGLDQGSLGLSDNYNSNNDYLTAINSRINNELIGGNNISAYSIGVRGADVIDIESFRDNLTRLSSDPVHNVVEVSNMSEASEKFAEIARQLYNQSTFYNVSLKLPIQNPGTVIRFTFDNVSNPEDSHCYIQGNYIENNGNYQLTDIQYVGLDSQSGNTVTASKENMVFIVFSFRNLTDLNGNQMSTDYVKQWNWIESVEQWQPNSEFTPSGNTEIVNEYKSAMIMLVLDCSSSLGSDFVNMKTAANGFIETLSGNYNGQ